MDKISNAQIAGVLQDAATILRTQQSHIHDLEEKLAARDQRDRAEKIASEMHRKGLELDVTVDELAARLEKAGEDKLATIETAVDMVGPDMGSKIAQVNNHDGGATSDSNSNLERYILGDAG
jgi:hypothetical protein